MDCNNIKESFKVIIAIDLQKQFKDNNGQYEKCLDYIKSHINDCYVLGTVFYNYDDSMYEKHLNWLECKDISLDDLSENVEYPFHKLILKSGYGLGSDNYFDFVLTEIYKIASEKQNSESPNIEFCLIGCDADACVLATAFTLWDKSLNFTILSDYIYTTAEDINIDNVLTIMRRNFGDCLC